MEKGAPYKRPPEALRLECEFRQALNEAMSPSPGIDPLVTHWHRQAALVASVIRDLRLRDMGSALRSMESLTMNNMAVLGILNVYHPNAADDNYQLVFRRPQAAVSLAAHYYAGKPLQGIGDVYADHTRAAREHLGRLLSHHELVTRVQARWRQWDRMVVESLKASERESDADFYRHLSRMIGVGRGMGSDLSTALQASAPDRKR